MVTVVTPMPVPAPSRTMTQVAFDAANAARIAAEPIYTAQFNAAVAETNENAIVAAAAAAAAASQVGLATAQAEAASDSASAAAVTANAAAWVAGNYALNASAISGINGQTYRNFVSAGVRNIDPASDPVNWVALSGTAPPALPRSPRTGNVVLGATDKATLIDITGGTFTQTFSAAATLGDGWNCYLQNSGTGDITLDSNGAELIDGLTSYVMYPGECRRIQCDGVALRSVVVRPFYKAFAVTATFVKPPGYSVFNGEGWHGGTGGESGYSYNTGTGGDGSGGRGGNGSSSFLFSVAAASLAATVSVTVAAGSIGGTGVGGVNTAGNAAAAAGTSSFGAVPLYLVAGDYNTGGVGGAGSTVSGVATPPAASKSGAAGGGGGGGYIYASTNGANSALGGAGGNGGNRGVASNGSPGAAGAAPGGGGGGAVLRTMGT